MVTIKRYDVVADDLNPRTISDDNKKRLRKSIEKNGLVGHPVWNKTTGHIVGGHQRLDALDAIMRTKDYDLEVLEVEMPLKDEIRLNVALNNQDSQGEFDLFAVSRLASDFDLDLAEDFGFSEDMIDINFPEFKTEEYQGEEPKERTASDEDIAKLKKRKKEVREKQKAFRDEFGDYNGEPKGILTVVFENDSGKKQWFLDHGIDDPPTVMHIYDLEKLFSTK